MKSPACYAKSGAFFGFLAVLFGAFGAHGLKNHIAPDLLQIFETGVRYQMYHALALFGLAGLPAEIQTRNLNPAALCFAAGIIIFSGSLYLLALTGVKRWGMVTPVGGLLLLAGWALLFFRLAAAPKSA